MFSSNTSQVAATATQPEAIDFDGTNDYLIRSGDLTGNTDGKTFTFSAWVWSDVSGLSYIYTTDNTSDSRVQTWISTTQVGLYMKNPSGVVVLNASATVPNNNPPKNTWIHVLWSIDLASTSNRSCYINDVLQSTVSWDAYSNDLIDFTQTNHNIAGGPVLGGYTKARLSNVYLDKTYRDMSVTANRRLFVTADLKPAAGQAALNPILYLTMADPTQPGKNSGTGGNFTLTGTVARSGRGPNQYNAPYSDLNGTTQYLRRTSIVGIADGKQFSFSCVFNSDSTDAGFMFNMRTTSLFNSFAVRLNTNNCLTVSAQNAAGTTILSVSTENNSIVAGRNYIITVSCDLTDTSKRWLYLNGEAVSVTWTTYTNDTIDFTIPNYYVGLAVTPTSGIFNGRLGALWFNTSYIDLSANISKFVSGTGINAKPVDLGANGELPTGTSPLIYLPMYGNDAGKNYGTGGDFTVYSGPYTGARGPNEFWGNKIDFNGNAPRSYLSRTSALIGVSDGNVISGSFWCSFDSAGSAEDIFRISSSGNGDRFRISKTSSDQINIRARNAAGTILLNVTPSGVVGAGDYYIQFCFDLSDSNKKYVYINGVSQGFTIVTYTNGSMGLSEPNVWIGTYDSTQLTMNGRLAEFYISTTYIDFSQEANRLKFRDAFGNPTDLPSAIDAGTVPNPAIYMRFDPTTFGTNSGTGGNFTVTSTPTDGGQL